MEFMDDDGMINCIEFFRKVCECDKCEFIFFYGLNYVILDF